MDQQIKDKISKFFSELSMYRRMHRQGPKLAGLNHEENLSPHIVRAAQIAYVLAFLEGANPEVAACIILFHDNGELRIGDQNKISARYLDTKPAELQAIEEQIANLPSELAHKIKQYYQESENRRTKEGIVAKDADWLEVAIFAKEMIEIGYKGMQNWIENVRAALETESAKELLAHIEEQEDFTNFWWQGLKKMTYKKLK